MQWAAFAALCLAALPAFIVVAGEDNPDQPIPLWEFALLKACAAGALYACYRAAKALRGNGYLPECLF